MNYFNELESNLKDILEKYTSLKVLDIKKLKGDASYRSYFRITTQKDNMSYVLMKWDPNLNNISEEATKSLNIKEHPFINITNYLKSIDIPVPEIFYSNIEEGVIILEDLGDTTLEKKYSNNNDLELYIKAIDLLAKLKYNSKKNPDSRCIAFSRKFDYDLYMWEFAHFIEYGIEAKNNIKILEQDRNLLNEYFSMISKELDAVSGTFTHRDYQSRNIMIKDDAFYIIDYQDALLSTPVYDIVALLRDSYIRFDNKTLDYFLDIYISKLKSLKFNIDESNFRRLFFLQTIQRKLKDGGRFVYIDRVKNNPSFLPYVSVSFRYAAEAMKKFNEFKELYKTLSKYVLEFEE